MWQKVLCASFLVVLFAVALVFAMGCKNSSTALYQSITADNAAVQTATTLYQAGQIPQATAKTILSDAMLTEAGLKLWNAGIQSGAISTAQPAPDQVSTSLLNLQKDLQQGTKNTARKKSYYIKAPYKPTSTFEAVATPPGKDKIAVEAVIEIAELAVELAPELETFVTNVFNANSVTQATINQAFISLDTSIAALHTVLNN